MPLNPSNGFVVDASGVLRCGALLRLPWLEHGFETRLAVRDNDGFCVAMLRQIHSAIVVRPSGESPDCGEGDALISSEPGRLLTVRTADCVPVLLVDPETRAVAAVHAGWRGVVAGVLPQAVARMHDHFGTGPGNILAAIGPCIREESFEVGAEVAAQFQRLFPERDDLDKRTRVDLAEACRRQLTAEGVPSESIFDCGCCTFADSQNYHSFRRDREAAGRMQAFIGIRPLG
ncbi:MAG: peptidoglycan editing factor PgeF [Bryobacterales bacterium]|nr:peptidoglycan editing factor PgeF [Bryobacterales bacterium]